MSPNPAHQIQTHNLLGPGSKEVISQALAILRPHLPTSLPLYRRLQFGRFFPATILLTTLSSLIDAPPRSEPWILAFVDRSCRPETEVWLFGSWEIEKPSPSRPEGHNERTSFLRSLIQTIKSSPVPPSLHQPALSTEGNGPDSSGLSRTDYTSHLSNPSLVLFGAIHSTTAHLLQDAGLVWDLKGGGEGMVPNSVFVFDLDSPPPTNGCRQRDELPDGLKWSTLEMQDFALVKSRTQIPRQDRTLAVLPCVAIFDVRNCAKDEGRVTPIAWSFVGLDGSLTTLHVEEEWRGRGLAKAVARKIFNEKMGFLWEDGVKGYGLGYVIEGNVASEKTCESLGGLKMWDAFWVRVDLEKVG